MSNTQAKIDITIEIGSDGKHMGIKMAAEKIGEPVAEQEVVANDIIKVVGLYLEFRRQHSPQGGSINTDKGSELCKALGKRFGFHEG